MKYLIPVLLLSTLWLACKSDKPSNPPSATTETSTESVPATKTKVNDIPAMTKDVWQEMYNSVTYIDYIWHELPFSVSQDEKNAIQQNISFISAQGLTEVPTHCKSIGRKSYQVNGDILLDADIYFGDGCAYYIFLRDEKPLYLNQLTPDGIKFYGNLFKQAEEQRQQIIQGGR